MDIIRVGDKVRIVTPTFIKRVGYPQTSEDYIPAAKKSLQDAGIISPKFGQSLNKFEEDVVRKYAILLLSRNNFGGPERTLHTFDRSELLNKEVTVTDKRTAKTGIYCKARRSSGYYDYDDWEPPSLGNQETHILLQVGFSIVDVRDEDTFFKGLVISSENVVKVINENETAPLAVPTNS